MQFSKIMSQFIIFGPNHQKMHFLIKIIGAVLWFLIQKLISKCMSQFITVYQNGIHKINLDHICNSTCNCNGRSNTNQMLTANQPQFIKFAPVYQASLVQKWSSTLRFHQTGALSPPPRHGVCPPRPPCGCGVGLGLAEEINSFY